MVRTMSTSFPVSAWIEIFLERLLCEGVPHFCRAIHVSFPERREDHLRLTYGIDGNILFLLTLSGKCTRESDHGDGRLSGT